MSVRPSVRRSPGAGTIDDSRRHFLSTFTLAPSNVQTEIPRPRQTDGSRRPGQLWQARLTDDGPRKGDRRRRTARAPESNGRSHSFGGLKWLCSVMGSGDQRRRRRRRRAARREKWRRRGGRRREEEREERKEARESVRASKREQNRSSKERDRLVLHHVSDGGDAEDEWRNKTDYSVEEIKKEEEKGGTMYTHRRPTDRRTDWKTDRPTDANKILSPPVCRNSTGKRLVAYRTRVHWPRKSAPHLIPRDLEVVDMRNGAAGGRCSRRAAAVPPNKLERGQAKAPHWTYIAPRSLPPSLSLPLSLLFRLAPDQPPSPFLSPSVRPPVPRSVRRLACPTPGAVDSVPREKGLGSRQ